MITSTNLYIAKSRLVSIRNEIDQLSLTGKTTITQPTGRFFYDPWIVKPEYQNTEIAKALSVLPMNVGEARVVRLEPGSTYIRHADIDDRYHLNISGTSAYLINLETDTMYKTEADGVWYTMDAGPIHVASNFGNAPRYQLVVRHLLKKNIIDNPIAVKIKPLITDVDEARYIFDNSVSTWLNTTNKLGKLADFDYVDYVVHLTCNRDTLQELLSIVPQQYFEVIY